MKLHEILFWFLILLLPTQLGKHFWPDFSSIFGLRVDYLSPTIYLTDILVVLILISWGIEKLKNSRYTFKILKRFLFPFLVFLLANVFFAQNPGAALYKFTKLIEFSLLGLYVAKNNFLITNYKLPITLAIIYSSLIAIFQFLKQSSLGGVFYCLGERTFNLQTPGIALGEISGRLFLRPYGIFSHPNSMAGFLLVALMLITDNKQQTMKGKILRWLTLGLGATGILLSYSRATWLVGLLVGLWWAIRRKLSLLFVVCSFLFLIFLGFSFSQISEKPVQERVQLAQVSLEMLKSNPLTGVGLNNFVVRLPEYWQPGSIRLLQPVHNIFLLIAAETGLIGLIGLILFLFSTYKRLLLITNYQLLITLGAILALGLFDHYWFTLQQNQLLATIVFGLSWSKMKL